MHKNFIQNHVQNPIQGRLTGAKKIFYSCQACMLPIWLFILLLSHVHTCNHLANSKLINMQKLSVELEGKYSFSPDFITNSLNLGKFPLRTSNGKFKSFQFDDFSHKEKGR